MLQVDTANPGAECAKLRPQTGERNNHPRLRQKRSEAVDRDLGFEE